MKSKLCNSNLVSITYLFVYILHSSITEFNGLSLPKELISNTIFVVHLQSTLMVMASERDFPFNISSDVKLNHIRYPQSYRITLLQVSSAMHKTFSNTYSTMYRIQLAVKRIPDYIKTILRLITSRSSSMIQRMLPTTFNNIARISSENEILINEILDQFADLINLLNEIQRLPIDSSLKFPNSPSDKTDLIVYNRFDSTNVLEKICTTIQQIKKQFEQIAQLIINLDIKTKLNLHINDEIIPILYTLENNAHFLYQLSSIYTDILTRYVLDRTAGIGRYLIISTDEERFVTLKDLSEELSNILHDLERLFIERENEFKNKNIMLQQAYGKLFNELIQNR